MPSKTISQLTAATTISGADVFAIDQSGVTKRVAASVVRGDIIDANIKSDAAIALSKLATGALPSAITVASANLVDGTIATADVANAAITAPKLSGAQTGSAPIYGCRAWVNFNGTRNAADTGASTNGGNVLIRASGNVTSVTKNVAGDFTVTFATALSDTNFSAVATADLGNNIVVVGDVGTHGQSKSTTAYRLVVRYVNLPGANLPVTDPETASVQIFR